MASTKEKVAIEVNHVSKNFKLPQEKVTSVKTGIMNALRRKRQKTTATQHALKDINFTIYEGEFFGIVGRNGSGKSTLLKILAGIYQSTKGSVKTYGKLVPFIELGVGFNPELTGRENVYLNGAILGFSEKEVEAMYDSIVDFAELRPFMDQKLKNYSSGMEVRLAFSMAVRAQADILLIDEVLAVGDADFQRKCYKYFNELKRLKKTVVFVSHDMDAVREYCTRAVLINEQEMIYEGLASEVASRYLRIMNPGQEGNNIESETADRWGDGLCKISDLRCKHSDKEITISHTVTFHRDCQDPVYGYRIRDDKGQEVCGMNSLIVTERTEPVKKGDSVQVEWIIDNALGDASYTIDTAVMYDGNHTVGEWWDGGTQFENMRERHTHYPVNPGNRLTMKKK